MGPSCLLPPFSSSYFSRLFTKWPSCCCYGTKRLITGSTLVSRFNGVHLSVCADCGLVQAQSFHERWEVLQFPKKYKHDIKLLTRLFPRNGIGSKYHRSKIKVQRPYYCGSFEIWLFLLRNLLAGLLNFVRDKHAQDGEMKVS